MSTAIKAVAKAPTPAVGEFVNEREEGLKAALGSTNLPSGNSETPPLNDAELAVIEEAKVQAAKVAPAERRGPHWVRATRDRLFNPFSRTYYNTDVPVLVEKFDNWTEVQFEAGLIEIVDKPTEG